MISYLAPFFNLWLTFIYALGCMIWDIQKQGLSIFEAEKVDDEDVWRR